jgi:hypothetical protein
MNSASSVSSSAWTAWVPVTSREAPAPAPWRLAAAPAAATTPTTPAMPSASQVLSVVAKAAKSASAVHVKGDIVDSGSKISLDVQMNKDGSASGTVGQDGQTIHLIVANGVDYVQFTKDLLSAAGLDPSSGPGTLLLNKWVSSKSQLLAGSGMESTFQEVSFNSFVSGLFGDISGEAAKASGTTTVDGVPVEVYKAQDGTAYVSTSSPHYLIRLVAAPSDGSGQVDFTGWDKPVRIDPPAPGQIYSGPGN